MNEVHIISNNEIKKGNKRMKISDRHNDNNVEEVLNIRLNVLNEIFKSLGSKLLKLQEISTSPASIQDDVPKNTEEIKLTPTERSNGQNPEIISASTDIQAYFLSHNDVCSAYENPKIRSNTSCSVSIDNLGDKITNSPEKMFTSKNLENPPFISNGLALEIYNISHINTNECNVNANDRNNFINYEEKIYQNLDYIDKIIFTKNENEFNFATNIGLLKQFSNVIIEIESQLSKFLDDKKIKYLDIDTLLYSETLMCINEFSSFLFPTRIQIKYEKLNCVLTTADLLCKFIDSIDFSSPNILLNLFYATIFNNIKFKEKHSNFLKLESIIGCQVYKIMYSFLISNDAECLISVLPELISLRNIYLSEISPNSIKIIKSFICLLLMIKRNYVVTPLVMFSLMLKRDFMLQDQVIRGEMFNMQAFLYPFVTNIPFSFNKKIVLKNIRFLLYFSNIEFNKKYRNFFSQSFFNKTIFMLKILLFSYKTYIFPIFNSEILDGVLRKEFKCKKDLYTRLNKYIMSEVTRNVFSAFNFSIIFSEIQKGLIITKDNNIINNSKTIKGNSEKNKKIIHASTLVYISITLNFYRSVIGMELIYNYSELII